MSAAPAIRRRRRLVLAAGAALALAAVALLVLALTCGEPEIEPGRVAPPEGPPPPAATALAERARETVWYEAVGTVRPISRVTVAPQVGGSVVEVAAEVGDRVEAGALLVRLESRELEARLEQARSALAAAEAALEEARLGDERVRSLFEREASTREELERADAARKRAEADVEAARQRVRETEAARSHARLESPLAGVVAERHVDPGDLAWPGRTLLVVHDPERLRLEAAVREGLIGRVAPGAELVARLPALDLAVTATVDEVVPSADPRSRSFLVRASLPPTPGLHPGMFGRLSIPAGEREVVRVPAEAIARVGQLETALVEVGGRWTRRHVTTGRGEGGRVEVLSGLTGGERVGLPAGAER